MTDYLVRAKGSEIDEADGRVFEIGRSLITGEKDFRKEFGAITSLEMDLLTIGSAVFAADRATERGEGEDYQRAIAVEVPVANFARLHPLISDINRLLRKLSDDWWSLTLLPNTDKAELLQAWPSTPDVTLLFSGGLDSLSAAVEFGQGPRRLNLISHRTKNPITDGAQRALVKLLEADSFSIRHKQFFVSSADSSLINHDAEGSQRTRSFLFLILGALAARRLQSSTVLMLAENGQMAIHLPLTSGRIGALSTHTAHPTVLAQMASILSRALSYPVKIENPYVYKTKAEVIRPVQTQLPDAIPVSTSCWKNARLKKPATHCGACIPCYVRRVAIETYGADPTTYAEDVWSIPLSALDEDHDGRRNLVDFAEFIRRFETQTSAELMEEFPELYSPDFDAAKVVAMYRRFAKEARNVLSHYPNALAIL